MVEHHEERRALLDAAGEEFEQPPFTIAVPRHTFVRRAPPSHAPVANGPIGDARPQRATCQRLAHDRHTFRTRRITGHDGNQATIAALREREEPTDLSIEWSARPFTKGVLGVESEAERDTPLHVTHRRECAGRRGHRSVQDRGEGADDRRHGRGRKTLGELPARPRDVRRTAEHADRRETGDRRCDRRRIRAQPNRGHRALEKRGECGGAAALDATIVGRVTSIVHVTSGVSTMRTIRTIAIRSAVVQHPVVDRVLLKHAFHDPYRRRIEPGSSQRRTDGHVLKTDRMADGIDHDATHPRLTINRPSPQCTALNMPLDI